MTLTCGKWMIRKQQAADDIWSGYWVTLSPWCLDGSHYAKDWNGFLTWQEAIDYINQRVATNGDS